MIDAEQVISQVQQNHSAPDWQVVYGKTSYSEVRGVIIRIVVCLLLGVILLFLSGFHFSVTLLLGLLGIVLAIIFAVRNINTFSELPHLASIARNTFIVLMPEGVVLCYAANDPELREVNTVDYLRVKQIEQIERRTINGVGLEVIMRDGNTGLLNLEPFPDQNRLSATILEAHNHFLMSLRQ